MLATIIKRTRKICQKTQRERRQPNPAMEDMNTYQRDCKRRCARYLLDMIEKYGAEIREKHEKETEDMNS